VKDDDEWQVSWLPGRCSGPPFPADQTTSGIMGPVLAGYSCGNSVGLVD